MPGPDKNEKRPQPRKPHTPNPPPHPPSPESPWASSRWRARPRVCAAAAVALEAPRSSAVTEPSLPLGNHMAPRRPLSTTLLLPFLLAAVGPSAAAFPPPDSCRVPAAVNFIHRPPETCSTLDRRLGVIEVRAMCSGVLIYENSAVIYANLFVPIQSCNIIFLLRYSGNQQMIRHANLLSVDQKLGL
jgi:hypothetical protein